MAVSVTRVVVLRPGALGDVLVTRELLGWLKSAFPEAETVLAAPGRRGELLARPGLADAWLDWDGAAFGWLFSAEASSPPPELLRSLFSERALVLAYLDLAGEAERAFRSRLARLEPSLTAHVSSSRPGAGEREFIGAWLARGAARFCEDRGLIRAGTGAAEGGGERFICVPDREPDAGVLILHPGSGSAEKNWPLDRFVAVGERLRRECPDRIRRIRVVSGEADGRLGALLSGALAGSEHVHQPDLRDLACELGNASLYLGNDSGVSHLAASVRTRGGHRPGVGIVFGPSDERVWGQPGALLFACGRDWGGVAPEEVYARLRRRLYAGRE